MAKKWKKNDRKLLLKGAEVLDAFASRDAFVVSSTGKKTAKISNRDFIIDSTVPGLQAAFVAVVGRINLLLGQTV